MQEVMKSCFGLFDAQTDWIDCIIKIMSIFTLIQVNKVQF